MDLNKWKHPILYPAAITVSEKKPQMHWLPWDPGYYLSGTADCIYTVRRYGC